MKAVRPVLGLWSSAILPWIDPHAADERGRPTPNPNRARAGGRTSNRRGSVTFFVLVCLIAITMISGALLRIGWAERQRLRLEERKLQVEWLVESGVDRANARLLQSRGDYQGESWEIPAVELGGRESAKVTIAVATPKDSPTHRLVQVEAEYPRDPSSRVRLHKAVTVAIERRPARDETP